MQRRRIKSLLDNKLCNVLLGIFNPFKHELPEYQRYDITRLRDKCRFLEVVLNRGGNCGGLVALFFDGAVCDWRELPSPDNVRELDKVYTYIKKHNTQAKSFFIYGIKKLIPFVFNKNNN